MTGQEFRDYVVRKFKRTDKDTELYEATTDVIADMRIQFNAEDYKEEAYITGISTLGDYKIALPSDFGRIIGNISIVDSDNTEYPSLEKISKERYDELYTDRLFDDESDMNKDVPKHFCIYAKQIFLGPVPDAVTYKYQINYTTEAYTAIVVGTTSVPFTDKNRNVLRSGVLAELYDGMEEFEESQYWRGQYLQGLDKLANNDNMNISDNDSVMYSGF